MKCKILFGKGKPQLTSLCEEKYTHFVRLYPGEKVLKSPTDLPGNFVAWSSQGMVNYAIPLSFAMQCWYLSPQEYRAKIISATLNARSISWLKTPITSIPQQRERFFYHAGDLGDIIYSLPTIRYLGGGYLYLGPHRDGEIYRLREQMTQARFDLIAPLLRQQSYVKEVFYSPQGLPHNNLIDLQEARKYHTAPLWRKDRNLVDVYGECYGIGTNLWEGQWLDNITPVVLGKYPVVINRTQRYHSWIFDWKSILYKYDCIFVGTEEEHTEFCAETGPVPWYKTSNLLELAQVIAGAKLFIGGQSLPLAIAEGLKKDYIIEEWDQCNNCQFPRKGVSMTLPPSVTVLRKKPVLNWASMWDSFSGYGQAVVNLVEEARKYFDVHIKPTQTSSGWSPAPKIIPSEVPGAPRVLFEAFLNIPKLLREKDILFTMWESTRAPRTTVDAINAKARCVIVPTAWCASCLSASGVDVPIEIVPLGTYPIDKVYASTFQFPTFGIAGRDLYNRKNINLVIDCFLRVLKHNREARLHVKTYSDLRPKYNSDKLIFEDRFVEDLNTWYAKCMFFINVPSGSGWELHLQQAMLVGCIPIATKFGGQSEFFDEGVGVCVKYRLEKAPAPFEGVWGMPSKDHLEEVIWDCYKHSEKYLHFSQLARERAKMYTWEKSGLRFLEVIQKYSS